VCIVRRLVDGLQWLVHERVRVTSRRLYLWLEGFLALALRGSSLSLSPNPTQSNPGHKTAALPPRWLSLSHSSPPTSLFPQPLPTPTGSPNSTSPPPTTNDSRTPTPDPNHTIALMVWRRLRVSWKNRIKEIHFKGTIGVGGGIQIFLFALPLPHFLTPQSHSHSRGKKHCY
jgi:hypothetical protein